MLAMLSGGAGGGVLWTADADHVAPGAMYALRAGVSYPATRVDIEAVIEAGTGELREVPYPYEVGYVHVDGLYWLADGPGLVPYVGGGIGWRGLNIAQATIDGKLPEASLRYAIDPVVEFLFVASAGVRVAVWGPVHIRADAHAFGVLGDQPIDEPTHLYPGFSLTAGIDLRWDGPADRDRDGVPDRVDQCPDEPEDIDFYDDQDGCPDPDNDRDGIPDVVDKCIDLPEDVDGFEDDDGCPDHNNDLDAFPDALDACPNEPETANGWEDGDGCPDTVPEALQAVLGIRPGIRFEGTTLTPDSDAELSAILAAAAQYPEAVLQFRIHTDGVHGAMEASLRAKEQAKALYGWIAAHGGDPLRFDFKAIGDMASVARDDEPGGPEKNRRVEIRLYSALGADGAPIPFTPVPPEEW
jgi:outer membrane protein OmpA-like peptidoglycan-associated protein